MLSFCGLVVTPAYSAEFTELEYTTTAALTATCAVLYPEHVSRSDSERMTELAYQFSQSIDEYHDPRDNIAGSVDLITAQLEEMGSGESTCQQVASVVLPGFGIEHRED